MDILTLASENILSPMVLAFALGFAAALARSDLVFPEAVAKALSIYLLFAIGFKGGVSVAEHGLAWDLVATIAAGAVLSTVIPLIAFAILSAVSRLSRIDAAAVAAHYGSISIVTFVAATSALTAQGADYEGYIVAVAAVMESPAILVALWLARTGAGSGAGAEAGAVTADAVDGTLWREIALNGSIVVLVGAFLIGVVTGTDGMAEISGFVTDPFKGVLALFLLDMGLIAGRGIRRSGHLMSAPLIGFGLVMPPLGAALGLAAALLIGLSPGGAALMATLAASASYIAVPAAMRVALPEANPGVYLTLSLCVTFPFNLTLGIPLYIAVAAALA